MASDRGTFYARSDRGLVRLHNEDKAAVLLNQKRDLLFVVCDGLGGHNKGDFAAQLAIDMLMKAFLTNRGFRTSRGVRRFFLKQVKAINKAIFEESILSNDINNMSTTMNAVVLTKRMVINLNIGDSRFYLINEDEIEQVSEDQTVVGYLVKTGQISAEEAERHPKKNILTNALGTLPSITFDLKKRQYRGEKILVCSDGLYNMLDNKDIVELLKTNRSTENKVNDLIDLAKERGGADNIAVCLWELKND
ncbi:MAG TPA: Stp1/IreP family PP2C-type Ser/Thr phosphatase [Bacilli bacterium]|nr:Stp1/IreP family PP2C-type Ser/Thr phosphatase [Bacilli bacterium]